MACKIFRTGNSAVVSLPPEAREATGLQLGKRSPWQSTRNARALSSRRPPRPGCDLVSWTGWIGSSRDTGRRWRPWRTDSGWTVLRSKSCTFCTSA